MSTWPKIALVAGCGVVIYAYGRKLTRTKANLIVTPVVSVQTLSLTGLILRADVQIKNPSDGTFSMKFPFVTLSYKGALLGSSQVADQNITIKAFSEVHIQKILIDIPLSGVLNVVSGLINTIQGNHPVKIVIKVATIVDLGWSRMNYEDTQEVDLIG